MDPKDMQDREENSQIILDEHHQRVEQIDSFWMGWHSIDIKEMEPRLRKDLWEVISAYKAEHKARMEGIPRSKDD